MFGSSYFMELIPERQINNPCNASYSSDLVPRAASTATICEASPMTHELLGPGTPDREAGGQTVYHKMTPGNPRVSPETFSPPGMSVGMLPLLNPFGQHATAP